MNLEKLIVDYKRISINIVDSLDRNDFDNLDTLLGKRQKIIDQVTLQEVEKNELKRMYTKYDLFKLDELIKVKFEIKKGEIKKELINLKKRKEASIKYSNINSRAVFLSKEI